MNLRDDMLEAVSLLPADDPVRKQLEAELVRAAAETRERYAELVREGQALREPLVGAPALAVPESLLRRLQAVPGRTPVRHPHFLTPFRAVAAAAILLLLLAPATAWLLPPAFVHQRLVELPRDAVMATSSPVAVAATQPSGLLATFADAPLSFLPSFPDPKPGTTFVGGGLTYLAGRPAAYARYQTKDQSFTLFQVSHEDFPLPPVGEYSLVATLRGDRSVRFWSAENGTLFLLVGQCDSALKPEECLQIPPIPSWE